MRAAHWKLLLVVAILCALAAGFFLYFQLPHWASKVPEQKAATSTPAYEIIGHSVQGRAIEAYTYLPAQAGGDGATRLFFAGGMHGGYEWNSVLLAYDFMDYLEAHPEAIPVGVSVTIVPDINPDGVYRVIGKEGRFSLADVPESGDESPGRFNADGVDLNRNFDCKWQPKSMWRNQEVSAGSAPFSEPESRAVRDFILREKPAAAIFWHSQANAVYASECEDGILPETLDIMRAYADAAGYPAVDSFDSYTVTGDSEGWLASIGIPAITVEMKTHETVEWEKNLAGIEAILGYYGGNERKPTYSDTIER